MDSVAVRAINCIPNEVSSAVLDYVRSSVADNTRRAYSSDIQRFLDWGGSIPSAPEVIANYLAARAKSHSTATLSRWLSSISKAHTLRGVDSPCQNEYVRATYRGVKRTHGVKQRQATPVLWVDVCAMVETLDGCKGIRDRALLLVGFAGAFRRSELVALTVEDVQFVKQGVVVHLRSSKTDQERAGRKVAIPHARGNVCPVSALEEWLKFSGVSCGPIFRPVDRHGGIGSRTLTAQSVALIVKQRAEAVGLDPELFSGHSLRSGLVTSAAQAGVSSWKIRQQTGHASDAMLARYIRDAQMFMGNAAGALF
jgi:integrase